MSISVSNKVCSKNDFNRILSEHLNISYSYVALFAFVCTIVFGLLAFCLYKLIKIISFYINQTRKYKEQRKPKTNNTSNPADDDEAYIVKEETYELDDYKRFTTNFQKTVQEYKTYNERLKKFYKEQRPGEEPQDLIDTSFVDASKDNY